MSSASRKVKNPLLTAAGEGFPYENYAESALLVPVTPATPAVLRDDAELDNFIGQEPVNSHHPNLTATQIPANAELTPIPLNSEDIKGSPGQPVKQGYLTSILSSLPNLSLSSITGDSSKNQGNLGSDSIGETQNANSYVPSQDHRDSQRDTSSLLAANTLDPRRSNLLGSGEVNAGNPENLSTPPQQTLPPTAVPRADGPVSYRLGNQKRLKYAAPPDLTSSASKPYPAPGAQIFFIPQNVAASPSILNPNESTTPSQNYHLAETPISTNFSTVQQSTFETLSQGNSLQGSFRSSPVATGNPYSSTGTPRSITPQSQSSYYDSVPLASRPGISISSSRPIPSQVLEPATPQNTPANVSFPSFELYGTRDFLATPNSEKEFVPNKDTSRISPQSQSSKDSASGCSSATFTPISATKISEKLEHLLAEQKEYPTNLSTENSAKFDENISFDSQTAVTSDKKLNENQSDALKDVSLSEVFLNQEPSEPTQSSVSFQEVCKTKENIDVSQNHAITSKVQPFKQYYQSQPPSSSGSNFFTDGPAEQFNLNNTTSVELPAYSFPDTSKSFTENSSSFFVPAQNTATFPPFKPTESNVNAQIDLIPTFPPVNLQQSQENSSFNLNPAGSPLPVPQSLWGANSQTSSFGATSSAPTQPPPPPLFFNPTKLESEPFAQPLLEPKFPPIGQPIANQAQPYFEYSPGFNQSYDIRAGSESIFLSPTRPMAIAVPEPTGSATLNPIQMSVNPLIRRSTSDTVPPSLQNLAAGPSDKRMQYRTVYHHWFHRKEVEHKIQWQPFSMQDSLCLEDIYNSSEITPETTVATDGGRYDVDILRRQRTPVYWPGPSTEVRRCSWFFKEPTESRYVPYDESTSVKLEEEYKQACLSNNWNRRIDLNNGEYIAFHSATVQAHYSTPNSPELAASWGNSAGSEDSTYLQGAASRPRVIKRGLDEFHIEDGEPEKVDHLLFLVHGIGSVCDLKFRTVEEVVDEFRSISLQLVQSHYRTASEQRIVNRIEVLPISWHTTLHSEDTGIDKKLKAITLESIPKLRHFTNDTLLDILFYTSPIYCQTIMQTVGSEMNRQYALFKDRNPDFDGGTFLGGHSLGSLILFDLLCHQKPLTEESTAAPIDENNEKEDEDTGPTQSLPPPVFKRRLSKKISYVMGAAGTGQPYINYPQLNFHPRAFFALGSPIGMFVTVRGIDTLGEDFALPTCPAFFNVFHPFDPVAYRVESLINPEAHKFRPMLIPHHKGRKRMHLELKETMARVGADLKQKLIDSVRSTWNSVYQLALFHKPDNHALEREIDKVVEEQLQQTPSVPDQQNNDDGGADLKVGQLNGGRRIDYVLQEAPFEYINEYIFALTSHVCYWESEDTMLMILKEIYGSTGIQADAQLPQQTMSIERISPSPSVISSPSMSSKSDVGLSVPVLGMDPTAPISEKTVGPPPKCGFVRKS